MKMYDDEDQILSTFRLVTFLNLNVVMFGNWFKCKRILNSLKCIFTKGNWINSSAKSDPPPDFYNNKQKLMMDMMIVEDNSFKNKKGKLVNTTKQREKELLKEYIGDSLNDRDDIQVFMAVSSGKPTNEDHNFDRYLKNFKRVVENHNDKIPEYQKNHPNFKTILFVFDQSCAYIEVENKKDLHVNKIGYAQKGKPHCCFIDKNFVDIIKQLNADYLIWFAPYKLLYKTNNKKVRIPKCAIYDIKNIKEKHLHNYNIEMMKSGEL